MAKSNAEGVYAAAHFGLELDGKNEVSLFRSIEGGGVKADVMTYQKGADLDRWRILGKPKFDDIKLQVGMSMTQPFYKWVEEFFAGKGTRKNGAIVAADFYYKERARRVFRDALLKELVFPKLDAQDKSPVYMNITLTIEEMEFVKGSGNKIPPQALGFDDKQKRWTANNFVFSLHGFGDACRRVTKVDSFTIKQNILEHNVGAAKATLKVPSTMDFPTLAFYVPEMDAQPFMDHFAKRVGFGVSGVQHREARQGEVREAGLHGEIKVYDNEQKPTFSVEFKGADIVSVTPEKSDATSEDLKLVKVELYTESMTFDWPVMGAE